MARLRSLALAAAGLAGLLVMLAGGASWATAGGPPGGWGGGVVDALARPLVTQSVSDSAVCGAPVVRRVGGDAAGAPALVLMTSVTAGAVIFYTTDGAGPTRDSVRYAGPFPLPRAGLRAGSLRVVARAFCGDALPGSAVVAAVIELAGPDAGAAGASPTPFAAPSPPPGLPRPCKEAGAPCGWPAVWGEEAAPAACPVGTAPRGPSDDAIVSRYPNLLTVRPAVDCDRGQYVHVALWGASGLGHQHQMHNAIMQIAIAGGFSVVYSELRTHNSHGVYDHDEYMHASLFSAAAGDIMACSASTNVGRYALEDDFSANWAGRLLSLTSAGLSTAEVVAMWSRLAVLGLPPMGVVDGRRVGFVLLLRGVAGAAVSYAATAPLYRYMARVGARALPQFPERDAEGLLSTVHRRAPCARAFIVGVHVRRGDVMADARYESWRRNASYYTGIVRGILRGLPRCLLSQAFVVVYTEGIQDEFDAFFEEVQALGAAGGRTVVSGHPVTSLVALSRSDVLITSHSAFSRLAALYSYSAVVAGAHISENHTYEGVLRGAVVVYRAPDGTPLYNAAALDALVAMAWSERCMGA